jgi:hypothetical protein
MIVTKTLKRLNKESELEGDKQREWARGLVDGITEMGDRIIAQRPDLAEFVTEIGMGILSEEKAQYEELTRHLESERAGFLEGVRARNFYK